MCVVTLLTASSAHAARPLTTGFVDSIFSSPATISGPWLDRTATSGAGIVLIGVNWSGVAPAQATPDFDAANPADPRYTWQSVDEAVKSASARGLQVALSLTYAPSWAEGGGRPATADPGTWRPSASAYGAFAAAAAKRYSGTFVPPNGGGALPRVRYWQAWSEPNLPNHLSPQWTRAGRRYTASGPEIYRALMNALYAAVKGVDAGNLVVTGGTAPFGDPTPGGQRIPPAQFWRAVFCVGKRATACPATHFDILAHDPYSIGGPYHHAYGDDVSVPDFARITRPLAIAMREGHIAPRRPKAIWATELSWDSYPDPQALPLATQAAWLEEAFAVLWREGIDTVIWNQIRDQPPVPDYASTYQSGVYFLNGMPKPSLTAFRFPFVTERIGRSSLRAWGRAPVAGTLRIERLVRGVWTALASQHVGAHEVFVRRLSVRGRPVLRASVGSEISLRFAQR